MWFSTKIGICAAWLAVTVNISAEVSQWTGTGSGSWFDKASWDTGFLPSNSGTAKIVNGSAAIIDGKMSDVKALIVGENSSLTVSGNGVLLGSLSEHDALTVGNGSFAITEQGLRISKGIDRIGGFATASGSGLWQSLMLHVSGTLLLRDHGVVRGSLCWMRRGLISVGDFALLDVLFDATFQWPSILIDADSKLEVFGHGAVCGDLSRINFVMRGEGQVDISEHGAVMAKAIILADIPNPFFNKSMFEDAPTPTSKITIRGSGTLHGDAGIGINRPAIIEIKEQATVSTSAKEKIVINHNNVDFNFSGGLIETGGMVQTGGQSAKPVNFSGGAIRATTDNDNFFDGFGGIKLRRSDSAPALTLTVNDGLTVSATNDFTFATDSGSDTRALAKNGGGTLILSGLLDLRADSGDGGLAVNSGTLILTNSVCYTGDLTVSDSACLTVHDQSTLNVNGLWSGQITGDGGALTISGTLIVNAKDCAKPRHLCVNFQQLNTENLTISGYDTRHWQATLGADGVLVFHLSLAARLWRLAIILILSGGLAMLMMNCRRLCQTQK